MAVDAETFKRALGSWATGVTIVTSRVGDLCHGMTVSAFNEVSLEPPLILICADKTSNTLGVIQQAGAFSVSILSSGQDELSGLFANKQKEAIRFDGLDCPPGATGCPRIPGALVWLDCSVHQAVDAGDHIVYIGQVEDAEVQDQGPLIHFRGRYGEIA
jgi:flavin reductase (DIM6/NTAB) family NADH-FMN oxidoreductase RutF